MDAVWHASSLRLQRIFGTAVQQKNNCLRAIVPFFASLSVDQCIPLAPSKWCTLYVHVVSVFFLPRYWLTTLCRLCFHSITETHLCFCGQYFSARHWLTDTVRFFVQWRCRAVRFVVIISDCCGMTMMNEHKWITFVHKIWYATHIVWPGHVIGDIGNIPLKNCLLKVFAVTYFYHNSK